VTAAYSGESAQATVTVDPASVDSVTISPSGSQTVTAGNTIEFSAEAVDQYGNTITDTDGDFSWNNTDSTGTFQKTTADSYEVNATYSGVTSQTVTVTVNPASVNRVEIDPSSTQEIETSGSIDFSAEAFDQYDNLVEDTDSAFTWSAEGGSISGDGLFDETTPGDYNVTAELNSVMSEETLVTVLEPAAFELVDTEVDIPSEVADGETLQVTYNVTNTGEVQGTETVELVITNNGEDIKDSETIDVSPGEYVEGTLSFQVNVDDYSSLVFSATTTGSVDESAGSTDGPEEPADEPQEPADIPKEPAGEPTGQVDAPLKRPAYPVSGRSLWR